MQWCEWDKNHQFRSPSCLKYVRTQLLFSIQLNTIFKILLKSTNFIWKIIDLHSLKHWDSVKSIEHHSDVTIFSRYNSAVELIMSADCRTDCDCIRRFLFIFSHRITGIDAVNPKIFNRAFLHVDESMNILEKKHHVFYTPPEESLSKYKVYQLLVFIHLFSILLCPNYAGISFGTSEWISICLHAERWQ